MDYQQYSITILLFKVILKILRTTRMGSCGPTTPVDRAISNTLELLDDGFLTPKAFKERLHDIAAKL